MQRIKEKITSGPSFIGSWNLKKPELCQGMINFFEKNKDNQVQGKSLAGLDLEKKNSIDMAIFPRDLVLPSHKIFNDYAQCLYECYIDYLEQWPFLKVSFPKLDVGTFNIQKYNPGGHFAKVHSERVHINSLHRLFAFMTYLNDDFEGGKTSFIHHDMDVEPVMGKTLIWPAEWTHAHKGNIVESGTKYIATGWINLPID
jgi:prolyl 4-hydroxylase